MNNMENHKLDVSVVIYEQTFFVENGRVSRVKIKAV